MSGPPGTEIFISSDMFFLEVLLEPSGLVRDVKIHHEGKSEQQVRITDIIIMIILSCYMFLSLLIMKIIVELRSTRIGAVAR